MSLLLLTVLTLLLFSCGTNNNSKTESNALFKAKELFKTPEQSAGQKDVLELRCEPIDTVRIGFIGLGMRGSGSLRRYTFIDNVKIIAICDIVPEKVEKSQKMLQERGFPKADEYTGAEDWKKICERDDIDLIYVCTHWDLHTPIAVYAM